MATFLIAHGAWTGGWFWRKMVQPLRDRGHELIVPTLTGLGEREHLAHANIDLQTHITDVLQVLKYEDIASVVLVGHSYGGMVATGVADRVAPAIAKLIYLDAFVPRHGQCLFDLLPENASARMREAARSAGDGWKVPPNPMPPDTNPSDQAWAVSRRVGQPIRCFEQPLALTHAEPSVPRAYVYCKRAAPGDVFRQFAERARTDPNWQYVELDASHNPHVTMPEELASALDALHGP